MQEASKCTSGQFKVDQRNKKVISDLFNYFMGVPGNLDLQKGIWLEGEVGTGKSTIMSAFSQFKRTLRDGFKVYICSQVTTEYIQTGSIELDKYLNNKNGYLGVPVDICFDELGREPIPAKHFGTELNVFQHILHVRYSLWQQTRLKTYITTNLKPHEVEKYYDKYIRDRRKEMFNIIALTGESRR